MTPLGISEHLDLSVWTAGAVVECASDALENQQQICVDTYYESLLVETQTSLHCKMQCLSNGNVIVFERIGYHFRIRPDIDIDDIVHYGNLKPQAAS